MVISRNMRLENYKIITENSNDLIRVLNDKLEIEYVNESAHFEILGYSKDDLIGKKGAIPIHPEETSEARHFLMSIFKYGKAIRKGRIQHKNGNWIWLEIKGKLFKDKSGNQKFLMISRDITERVKIEKKLKEERKNAETYLNLTSTILLALNSEGLITLMNKKGYEVLEYEEGELIEKNWFETCLSIEIKEHVFKIFEQLKRGEVDPTKVIEYSILTKNGKEKIIEWHNTIVYDDDGNFTEILSSGIDITEKKRAEILLTESEERLRSFIEETSESVFCYEYNPPIPINLHIEEQIKLLYNCILVECNLACAQSYGYNRVEYVINRKLTELLDTSSVSLDELFRNLIESNYHVVDFLGIEKLPNGEERYFLNNGHGVIEDGKLLRIWGTFRDITDRIKAEHSLEKTEKNYRQLFEKYEMLLESITDAVFVINSNWVYTLFNKSAEKFINMPMEEFLNQKITEVLPDVENTSFFKAYKNVMDTGKPERVKDFFILPNGKKGYYNVSVYPISEGILCIARDVTEEEKSRLKLQESLKREQFLGDIIRNASIGISIAYPDGKLSMFNKAFEKLVGYNKEELKNIDWNIDLTPVKWREFEQDKLEELHQLKKFVKYEKEYLRKNGTIVPVELVVHPKLDNVKNIEYYIAFITEIEERKKAQEALRVERDKLVAILDGLTNAQLGIDIIGDDYKTQYINEIMQKKFGNIIGKLCYKKYTNLNKPCENCPVMKSIKNNSFEQIELIGLDNRNYEIFSAPLPNPDGTIDKAIEVIIDITKRKRGEQKLKESEEKYRNIFEKSPNAIFLLDFTGKIIDCNSTTETIFGYTKEELIGQNYLDLPFYSEVMIKKLKDRFQKIRKESDLKEQELEIIKKDGNLAIIKSNITHVSIGAQNYFQAIIQDISGKKKAEVALKESEEKYRILFKTITEGVIMISKDRKIIEANPAAENILDFTRFQIENLEDIDQKMIFIHPDGTQITSKESVIVRTMKEKKIIENVITGMKHLDNHVSWLNVSTAPLLDETNNLFGVVATFSDITKQKETQQKLRESEEKFRTIAEQSLIGIGILQDNIVKYVNKKFADILGYTTEEIMNWTPNEFLKSAHPGDREMIFEQVKKKQDGLNDYLDHYEFRGLKKSGEIIWIDNFTRSILYEGRLADLVTFVDITEKKKVEEELIKLNKLKSELLSRASHELKTPLMSIKGFTDLFLIKYRDILNDDESYLIHEIRKGSNRLEALIKDILKTAELESGSVVLNKSENDLLQIIITCVDDLRGFANSRNHYINLMIYNKLITDFETQQIRIAINNILSNAIKYTPPYGKIDIKSHIENNFIIISIKDSGIGFLQEEKNQLFKKFGKIERFGQGYNVITEGSGLGLYISKMIIKLHGGDLWVESEGRNKGSTFYFSLPIHKK